MIAARIRRVLALGATFAVLLAGLTLAPAPQAAHAISDATVATRALAYYNAQRVSAKMPKLKTHPAISAFAQKWAKKKAAAGTFLDIPATESVLPNDGMLHYSPGYVGRQTVQYKGHADWVGKLGLGDATILQQGDGVYTHVGIGYATKGKFQYVVVVLMAYPLCAEKTLASSPITIAGTGAVGSPLAPRFGTWTKNTQFTYRWNVAGETVGWERIFVPAPEHKGAKVTLVVTGYQGCYADASRAASRTITPGILTKRSPVVSGARNVGETLSVAPGSWLPADTTLSIQWLRNGAVIPEATATTYELVAGDRGKRIDVRVTGAASGYTTSAIATATKVLVDHPLLATAPTPTIGGEPVFRQVLTADAGVWEPAPVTLSYQWRLNGVAIAGATKTSYAIPAGAVGKKVTVTVTGSRAGFASASRTSEATPAVGSLALTATTTPVIVGTPKKGTTLKVATGAWTPSPTLTFQWFRNGTAIPGASKSSYTITTAAKKGQTITVRVTAVKPGYTKASRFSLPVTVR